MSRFVQPEPIDGSTRVVKVLDVTHGVHRACRTVPPDVGSFPELRERLRTLARLSHPHLARLVAVGEEGGELKVVSEWVSGGPLAQGPDPATLVGPVEALGAMHRAGVAHGLVRPEALVVGADGKVKWVDAALRPGSVGGDLEALGLTLRALHVGRPMPPALARVADRAVGGRYADALALAADLRAAGSLAAVAPREEEDHRRAFLLLALALLGVLVVVGGAGLLGLWTGTHTDGERIAAPTPPAPPRTPAAAPVVPSPPTQVVASPAPRPRPEPRPEVALPEVVAPVEQPPTPTIAVVRVDPEPIAAVVHIDPVPTAAVVRVDPAPPAPPPPLPPSPPPGWRVERSSGPHPTTTLSLDASNVVTDRAGRQGRPRLEIRCDQRRLSLALVPGVASVEAIPNEVGVYSVWARVLVTRGGDAALPERLKMQDGDPRLVFPAPERWVERLGTGHLWHVSYTPFASPSVVADFDVTGLDTVLSELASDCGS